ncbi:unnamed protein product [Peniophora sp. CBMAI 1063]|nr:unnamed protein product [Peniophora sp. CBMAI 1063]
MATLTRPVDEDLLSGAITVPDPGPAPAPFTLQDRLAIARAQVEAQAAERSLDGAASRDCETEGVALVQQTVLTTLSDLLLPSPARRHSMPAPSSASASPSPTAALRNLVLTLRERAAGTEMVEAGDVRALDETSLLAELGQRVEHVELPGADGDLARALARVLGLLDRLNRVGLASPAVGEHDGDGDIDIYSTLARQLAALQATAQPESPLPPVQAVERALLWDRLSSDLETVLQLCRARAEMLPPPSPSLDFDGLPAYYDNEEKERDNDRDKPPVYEDSPAGAAIRASAADEKMRMDLDAVTGAIDRLYRLAPQLHSQRAELRIKTPTPTSAKGKQKATPADEAKLDAADLDGMLNLIGRASARKMADQTARMDPGVLARAKERSEAQRNEFVGKLVEHAGSRRMTGQDAAPPRERDPEARLMTLPEFIRESSRERREEREREVKEREGRERAKTPPNLDKRRSLKSLRSRSMSAPSLSWFLRPSSGSSSRLRPSSSGSTDSVSEEPEPKERALTYVAEHHAALKHVLAFISMDGKLGLGNLEYEVEDGELVVSGTRMPLPAPVAEGKVVPWTQAQGHLELKLPTTSSASSSSRPNSRAATRTPTTPNTPHDDADEPAPLLDATTLSSLRPHTLSCSSCSLPLVRTGHDAQWDDLPSEHWAELVDAWMCHGDMALNERVARHARGMWPRDGQVLVGGSYVLVGSRDVVQSGLRVGAAKPGEDWRSVRCKCGTYSGRCQDVDSEDGPQTVFRFAKYAIRPMTASADPPRIPLSAFVLADMDEHAAAHATYRFVVLDEEEARPRLLLWLFKPSLKLAYRLPKHYMLPERDCVRAGKVLYKILGPGTQGVDFATLLNRYPGFPQAEHLMYPKDVCTRIAALLKESTKCYPESLRTMTGLDVGWLLRA